MIVLLDTGPLGMLTNPTPTRKTREAQLWMRTHLVKGVSFRVPEIADYELRRNLILENLTDAISRLDALAAAIGYLPLTLPAMRKAAELWADVRRQGLMTAPKEALDGDAILAAQAAIASDGSSQVIIATTNLGHLGRFNTSLVTATEWQNFT